MSKQKIRLAEKRLKKATIADPGDITTADATDLASAEALANATKAKVNALLDAMRAEGLIG
ncbi:MAG TPA: hypothetical protein VIM48_07015 [Chthoniobacterales bacterium]